MRLSSVQKDCLFILYALLEKGKTTPTPGADILKMINRGRPCGLYPNNFRTSCHTLADHGLIRKFRSDSLALLFTLSESGKDIAKGIYKERTAQNENS
jgi:hypothetical protein